MKKCTYCGREHGDEATVCDIDASPLVSVGQPPKPDPVKRIRVRSSKIVMRGCFLPLLIVVSLIMLLFIIDAVVPSGPRRALPPTASEIQEYYDSSVGSDFIRVIKAKLPEADYHEYARRLNLSIRFDPAVHEDIRSQIQGGIGTSEAPWWDPPSATTNTYFAYSKGDQYKEVLNYKEGFVYFLAVDW